MVTFAVFDRKLRHAASEIELLAFPEQLPGGGGDDPLNAKTTGEGLLRSILKYRCSAVSIGGAGRMPI
jgi:hypothetical protein